MTKQDGPAPRRALPPRDEEPQPVDGGEASSSARRGLWSATGADTAASKEGTLIPPPAALPPTDIAPASVGRRFSAVELPEDAERPLPRRSALSPAATRAQSPASPDRSEASPAARAVRPKRRRTGWIIGSVAALVAVVLAVVVAVVNPFGWSGLPGSTPTPSIDPVATYLLQSDDLSTVLPETTWDVADTVTTVDPSTPAAKCLAPVMEEEVQPESTMVRTFAPPNGTAAAILHQVETYATPEDATAAYAARAAQLGACTKNTAWVQTGYAISGVSDEATGSLLVLQGSEPEYHTLVLSRTGSRLNIVDATQASSGVDATALMDALTTVSARQCTVDGTCPSTAAVEKAVPLATDPAGYLASVDLPRITPGAGVWRGTPVADAVTTAGTRCEAIDLTQGQGAAGIHQRTLVLQEDAAAPQGFGVDEVVYTYETAEAASAAAQTLSGNITQCADRSATAQVASSGDVAGAGTGTTWVVTQKVDQSDTTVRFRVAVVTSGTQVIYLMANPSADFDLSDEAFIHVVTRAAERLAQIP